MHLHTVCLLYFYQIHGPRVKQPATSLDEVGVAQSSFSFALRTTAGVSALQGRVFIRFRIVGSVLQHRGMRSQLSPAS